MSPNPPVNLKPTLVVFIADHITAQEVIFYILCQLCANAAGPLTCYVQNITKPSLQPERGCSHQPSDGQEQRPPPCSTYTRPIERKLDASQMRRERHISSTSASRTTSSTNETKKME
ncbi:hypothetical protein PMIN06_011996 [Paraphaeosphaeria minitans]